jgi:hypothetical protein
LWGIPDLGSAFKSDVVQIYVNGTELFENEMPDIYFSTVQTYYHSEFASVTQGGRPGSTAPSTTSSPNLKMYSFALKSSKHQPCGTCNFSRLDTASLTLKTTFTGSPSDLYLYAVNFNVFRIKNGLGGLAFSS